MTSDDLIVAGHAAMAACDWATARSSFQAALDHEDPGSAGAAAAAYGLGLAHYWCGDYTAAIDVLAAAFRTLRDLGDRRTAARVATQLAMLHGLVRGDGAAVGGWLGHAERILGDDDECAEAGWVALFRAAITSDPAMREQHAHEALSLARRYEDVALEYDALAYLGKSLVETDRVREGLGLVDEAMAAITGGLVADPWATAEILCTLFHVGELAADLGRTEEWLGAVDAHVARTGETPTFGTCRTHYGGLLTAAGRWEEAEAELLRAVDVYDAGYRGARHEPLLRLADLWARQGRREEAERLLGGYEDHGDAVLPRARLLLAAGEAEVAATILERRLSLVGRGVASVPISTLLVQALLAAGEEDAAQAVADDLSDLAVVCDHPPVRAAAALARARVEVATGGDGAVAAFEEALAAYTASELTCDLAIARLELAVHVAASAPEVARAEARAALTCFERIGASGPANEAARLLRALGDRRRPAPRSEGTLTTREAQVLALVAEGCSNVEIAERLFISLRTAEHHVSNILAKLGAANRTEAAAHLLRTRAEG